MSKEDSIFATFLFGWIVSVIVMFVWGLAVGSSARQHDVEKDAIKAGVGEWKVDVDGNRIFNWKVCDGK